MSFDGLMPLFSFGLPLTLQLDAFSLSSSGHLFDAPLTPGAIVLALGFSVTVGLSFGIYSAQRAERLNPIDALRFE